MRERISWELIKRVMGYPTKEIYQIIDGYRNRTKVFIIKNDRDIQALLDRAWKDL
jgi:hypothetical protein